MVWTPAWLLTLGVARGAGAVLRALRSPLGRLVSLVAVVVAGLAVADTLLPGGDWLTPQTALALCTLALVGGWVLRQRRRLMVGRFDAAAGNDGTPALGALLAGELTDLRELFLTFEDGGPADDVFGAAIQVDSQASVLEGAVAADATVSLGPIKLPTQLLARLVNTLLQGPRLSGQLLSDGGRAILTAELVAHGRQRVWRVEDGVGATPRTPAALVQELALRIFADIAFAQPPRWTAVAALAAGLRAYRRTLRSSLDARLHLVQAEHHLLDASGEDRSFDLPQYNLGVLYGALDRPEAARAAFVRAIELRPERFESHHALARALTDAAMPATVAATQLRLALDHCDRALAYAKGPAQRAKALHLRSQARVQLQGLDFYFAASDCRATLRAAWAELLRAELGLTGDPVRVVERRRQARQLAATSLRRLAAIARQASVVTRHSGAGAQLGLLPSIRRVRRRAARLGAWLAPDDAETQLERGLERLESRDPEAAVRHLTLAAQLPGGRADAWCTLALAHARLYRTDEFAVARAKAMNALGLLSRGFLPDLAAGWRRLAAYDVLLMRRMRAVDPGPPGSRQGWRLLGLVWTLSGRRWRRLSGTVLELPTSPAQRAQAMAALAQATAHARAESRHVAAYPQRQDAARKAAAAEDDRRPALETALQAARDRGWYWEAGDLAHELGKASVRRREDDAALHWYGEAIALFAAHHPVEVARRGLEAGRARVLLAAQRRGEALAAATQAARIDPMSSYERSQLADCHFELGAWSAARAEWEVALRFSPDRADLHYKIAVCWHNEAGAATARAARRDGLERAAAALERSLSLYPPDDPAAPDVQYMLAEVRGRLGQVDGCVSLWRTLESRGHRLTSVRLRLADALLREETVDEAQHRYRQLAATLAAQAEAEPEHLDELPDSPSIGGDTTTRRVAGVWAHLGEAAAMALRRVGLDGAAGPLQAARRIAETIPDVELQRTWLSLCDRIGGENALLRGDTAAARALLERSLAGQSHPGAYRLLAETLLKGLDTAAADTAAVAQADRVRELLDLADRLDYDELQRDAIAQLRLRLARCAAAAAK